MVDPYLLTLIGLNLLLPIVVAIFFYRSRQFRDNRETIYAIFAASLWAARYLWIFAIRIGITNDLLNRFIGLVMVLLILFSALWLERIFPIDKKYELTHLITNLLQKVILAALLVGIPLSIFLPSDLDANDINYDLRMYLLLIAVVFVLLVTFRTIPRLKSMANEYYLWYNVGFFFGIILIVTDVTIFTYVISDSVLKSLFPVFGFIIIIGTLILFRVFPLVQFAMMVNTGVIIVQSKTQKVEYMNQMALDFIDPDFISKETTPFILSLWPDQYRNILDAYKMAKDELRTVQIEERLYNYSVKQLQNVQLTFYPYGGISRFKRVGVLISNSDEIQFLKQRKEFLLDILNHDIANVSQTLRFSLESLQEEKIEDKDTWETINLARNQNRRLEQLVFSAQNLLFIDSITDPPKEGYSDFHSRMTQLIEEEWKNYPTFKVKYYGFSLLKSVQTTGNLKAGFSLVLQSIFEATDEKNQLLEITTKIDEENLIQKIIFRFNSEIITPEIISRQSYEQKSEIIASSFIRVNLLVASAIIQKNKGEFNIRSLADGLFSTEFVITLPIYQPDKA
ncbi:MAG: hypothetical protein ACW99F_09270 [Candidatus Hodarchaeales archaeon]|jgi:hypothetical protein